MNPKIAVIIISNNCPIKRSLDSLHAQTRKADQIIVVDNHKKTGFWAANNESLKRLDKDIKYVLFLNSDAFLTKSFIEKALIFMEESKNASCGAMTGILLGYEPEKEAPTGLYDSTGIFSTPYGKWFDRDQGQEINTHLYKANEEVPALCGALMLCRKEALMDDAIYKDDIDLSLGLRKKGWKLMLVPELIAYHCRESSLIDRL